MTPKVKGRSADENNRKKDHNITAQENSFPKGAQVRHP
jgi:hypothetical protein